MEFASLPGINPSMVILRRPMLTKYGMAGIVQRIWLITLHIKSVTSIIPYL
jgi:hypothetical protein